jgi:hypothetical protein
MLSRMLQAAGASWRLGAEAGGWELMLDFAGLGLGIDAQPVEPGSDGRNSPWRQKKGSSSKVGVADHAA